MNNKNTIKNATVFPGKCAGKITIPPSKSFAHRAVICAALAKGESHIRNIAYSQDIKATIECMRKLGAEITENGSTLTIKGVGYRSVIERTVMNNTVIDCYESGSTLRFLIPVFALSDKTCRFTGKGRLMQRPQDVYAEIFASQYKDFIVTNDFIETKESLSGGIFKVRGNVSSQFITGLLFSLPLLEGESEIRLTTKIESKGYIDMTLKTLKTFGITVTETENGWSIPGGQKYHGPRMRYAEGDWSNAAFWLVAGAIGGSIGCQGLDMESPQGDRAIAALLEEFGAETKVALNQITATHKEMKGIRIDASQIPDMDAPSFQNLHADCARKAKRCGQPAGEMTAAAMVIRSLIFHPRRKIRMPRSGQILQFIIILRASICVFNHGTNRCAAGFPFK